MVRSKMRAATLLMLTSLAATVAVTPAWTQVSPSPTEQPDCRRPPQGDAVVAPMPRACGGVIVPPPTGDAEIAKPAPTGSSTRVIRPKSPDAPQPKP